MEIRDLPAYVGTLLEKNDADLRICKKFVRVQAEQGVPGQEVETILKDGHKEVAGVVKVDNEGNPDWIITNPSGEKYTCPHSKFIKKYELEAGADGKHAPISSPIVAVQVPENITFSVPWGENGSLIPFNLRAGGYLNITNLEDIYGIARDEFQETYAECTKSGIFLDKNLRKAFEQDEFNMDNTDELF